MKAGRSILKIDGVVQRCCVQARPIYSLAGRFEEMFLDRRNSDFSTPVDFTFFSL
jgi:hypothetical protein